MAFSNPEALLASAQQVQQSNAASTTAKSLAKSTKETVTDGDPSRYELIAFISHMGESTAAGHYVCHIKRTALSKGIPGVAPACTPSPCLPDGEKADEWVIFNDEKFPEDSSIMVSREARSALSKAASSFVLCVTSMASIHCEAGKRKTLAASDVIGALRDMQFGHFESPLLQFLESKLVFTFILPVHPDLPTCEPTEMLFK
ncbi:unnamed protein product [Hydatigera taeniaeformis]|uniref:DNA polymerase epsilon subunit 3 n=1 Tax=Hydatigena taeniaeformis TaxID=6205 RepID=A0A0R3WUR2_HYDTA|nr:unnamed protein product [Hydatigera taeniaeformis]